MFMEPNLSLVTLGTTNLKSAIDFYENGLGWKRAGSSTDDVAFFQLSGIAFALWSTESLAKDAGVENTSPGFDRVSLAINLESESAVDELMAKVEKAGGKVTRAIEKTFWGGYSGYFSDLDGHLWEIAHNPFWELRDGQVTIPD